MITFDQAREIVRGQRWEGAALATALRDATGKTLAHATFAQRDSPPFTNSSMDGYAVGSALGPWKVVGIVAAGSQSGTLGFGDAMRIFTGAPTPRGTFAVIPQEDCGAVDGILVCKNEVLEGGFMRVQGEEFTRASCLFEAGTRVTPPVLSALAAQGRDFVDVLSMPRVAILTTGSELLTVGEPYQPGKIYDSNAFALESIIRSYGCQVTTASISDDAESTLAKIENLTESHDLLLTVGGVSVGDFDFVRPAIEKAGFQTHFAGVALRPGKPVAFGTKDDHKAWFGLPGNPMSAMITCCLFVGIYLGRELEFRPVPLSHAFKRVKGREEFLPSQIMAQQKLCLNPSVGSHATAGLAQATGLARIPGESEFLEVGTSLDYADFPWQPT